jgi:sodium-dependent dicarboxylate transporter 2/3/5
MQGVEWPTVAFVAAITAMRAVIGNPDTGIPQMAGNIFGPLVTAAPFPIYRLIGQVWVGTQTQLMSNMVSATLVYTVMIPALMAAGVGNPAAMAFTVFTGARTGFALPSATSTTAMVTGSGWVPIPYMFKWGGILIVPVAVLFTFVFYPWVDYVFRLLA